MKEKKNYEILIIDDDEMILNCFEDALFGLDVKVHGVKSGFSAIQTFKKEPKKYAAAFVDLHLGEMNGVEVAKALKKLNPLLSVKLISGDNSEEAINSYLGAELDGCYIKPLDFVQKIIPDLQNTLKKFDETQRVVSDKPNQNQDLIYLKTGLIGDSRKTKELGFEILQIAQERSEVLILGENGTGKEVVASAIHRNSKNSKGKYVAVNCSAFTENLAESELFGYVKGAFTGANKDTVGKIEAASGGTLFLDEVGEMPLELQAKLLRVLENKEYYPVGSTTPKRVNTRIIAATNVDIEAAIELGKFRRDLFYRLNTFKVHLSPLRDRPQDIKPLVSHFKARYEMLEEVKIDFLESVISFFESYNWPGNVRELRNEVLRACAMARRDRGIVEPKHLDSKFYSKPNPIGIAEIPKIQDFEKSVESQRREIVSSAYRTTRGHKTKAASLLGVAESTFRGYLKKYKIEPTIFGKPV